MRASTEYVQNWHLAAAAVQYGASENAPSAVQHYWSLSAEEQFYLVWPVLLMLPLLLTRMRGLRVSRRSLALVMAALTAGSFAYSVYRTQGDRSVAYFVTPTRAWEFGLGGLLAALPTVRWRWEVLRSALSWAGLAAIAVAAVSYNDASPFPGFIALLPVLGAVALMLAGSTAHRSAPTPVLKLPPVQFLGDISYSVYLWHWPLFVLAPFVIGRGLHADVKVVLLLLTLVAAWVTKRTIEDPIRRGRFLTGRKARWTLLLAAVATTAVMAAALEGSAHVRAQIRKDERHTNTVLADHPRCFGAAALDPEHPCNNPALASMVVPTPLEARHRPNSPCHFIQTRPFNVCSFGAPRAGASATIALVGDSHASHWRAALDVVARRQHWYGLSITRSGCPFSRTVKLLRGPLIAPCVRWNHELPGWFARHPQVSTLFVVQEDGQKWLVPRGESEFNAEVAGFTSAWRSLPPSIKHVVVIRDTPKNRPVTGDCVQRAMSQHRPAAVACAVPRRAAIARDAEAVAAVRLHSSRVRVVDLTHFFCDSRRCLPVIGGVLVHKDDHHLTAVYATSLAPYLQRALRRDGL
jgi:peptidoglycan/LPS O-acetylase OafA/YrhL